MRVVFLGTPAFAAPSLKALAAGGHEMAAVFTQPDRPKGRGGELAESAVKTVATQLGIPVYQPERIRRAESIELLRELGPDIMVVVGYGQIIPQAIIDLPRHGILNVHASLLPKYRGAAPIQWAIANGEKETGVTIMQIDAGLDTGDMLLKERVEIGANEAAPGLSDRLASIGAQLLLKAVKQIEDGTVRREKQNEDQASYAPILKKEDGLIDWSLPAWQIYNRLRGFSPWPGAYTVFREQQLLLLRAKPEEAEAPAPGAVIVKNRRVVAGCGGNTALELVEVQLAGKKRMAAESFANGDQVRSGERLGVKN
jgi:methionyl-tRNA formyltransferase